MPLLAVGTVGKGIGGTLLYLFCASEEGNLVPCFSRGEWLRDGLGCRNTRKQGVSGLYPFGGQNAVGRRKISEPKKTGKYYKNRGLKTVLRWEWAKGAK